MANQNLLGVVAASEALTGLVSVIDPALVVRLLFGAEITGAGVVMSRIAGISLLALGLACWPAGKVEKSAGSALQGMLGYSLLITLYLGGLGIGGDPVGNLFWPALVTHAIITIFLGRAWLQAISASR
jgi:hypothetical protein